MYVQANASPEVKQIIVNSRLKSWQDVVEGILQTYDNNEIRSRVQQLSNLL